jgi:hypothetical protein
MSAAARSAEPGKVAMVTSDRATLIGVRQFLVPKNALIRLENGIHASRESVLSLRDEAEEPRMSSSRESILLRAQRVFSTKVSIQTAGEQNAQCSMLDNGGK